MADSVLIAADRLKDAVAAIVAAGEADLWPNYGHHFRHNAALFLCRHPKCSIGIRDEYGDAHPVENADG